MAKVFRAWDVDQGWLLPPSLHEFVPPGHMAHFVRDTVREVLDLSVILDPYTEERGYPPYHPGMMVALLLYGYSRDLYSSRQLARACEERVDVMAVTGLTIVRPLRESDRITTRVLDLKDPDAGNELGSIFAPAVFDVVTISAGIFGPEHQDVGQAEASEIEELFWINAISPVRLARKLLPHVRPGGVIAFLSSRTGSISLNDDGDMELYRASKAALNSLTRSLAVKDALPKGVGILLIHPGWVQTDMGGSAAPLTVAESVEGICSVLRLALDRPEHRFVDYRGNTIEW